MASEAKVSLPARPSSRPARPLNAELAETRGQGEARRPPRGHSGHARTAGREGRPARALTPRRIGLWSYQRADPFLDLTRPPPAWALSHTWKAAHGQGRHRQRGPGGEVRHREGLAVHPLGGRRGP